jgi:hypothetical protein
MADPCWLPSAIMQTTGALIGIYLFTCLFLWRKRDGQNPHFSSRNYKKCVARRSTYKSFAENRKICR